MPAAPELEFFRGERLRQAAFGEGGASGTDALIDTSLAGKFPAAAFEEDSRHGPYRSEQRVASAAAEKFPPARAVFWSGFFHGTKTKCSGPVEPPGPVHI